MKRLLLLGATGKMGLAIQKIFSHSFVLYTPTRAQLNVQDPKQLETYINMVQPHVVCNCIAFMGLDACEAHHTQARAINRYLPKRLARLSTQYHHTLLHISTEAVFADAPHGQSYDESHSPAPINMYGQSKWEGEQEVQQYSSRFYIFRLPLLFGPVSHKRQFVEKMLLQIQTGTTELFIADDIISTPSYTMDLAQEMFNIILNEECGIFHLCNTTTASYFVLIETLMRHIYPHVHVHPAKHRDFPFVGKKNLCTPLSTRKRTPLRSWKEAMLDYVALIDK